jgi:Protein of unknown function (DUF2589)
MPEPGQELATLDFETMLGAPLVAAIHAQAQSALATVNFVKQIGFEPPADGTVTPTNQTTGKPATVTFTYAKEVPRPDGTSELRDVALTVPLLTLIPMPYLRLNELVVVFKAEIVSTMSRDVDAQVKTGADLDAEANWAWGSLKLKANYVSQRTTQERAETTRNYDMDVEIFAVGEGYNRMEAGPGGLERVLTMLQSLVKEEPQEPPR